MDPKAITFDDLLMRLGGFGRYQITCTLLLCIPAAFLNAWTGYDLVFMLYSPDKTCQEWNMNSTLITQDLGETDDPCDYEGAMINGGNIHCQNWTLDHRYFDSTIRTQWGICRRDFLAKNVLGIFAVAGVIGLLYMSVIQDYFGRRTAFFISLTLTLIGNGSSLLAPSLIMFVALRFLKETQGICSYNIPFLWAQEFVGPQHRTWVNFLVTLFYSMATVSVGVVAYFCRTWTQLGLVTIIPFTLLYFYAFLLDESPRWLLSVGKIDEAQRIIEKIAIVNNKHSEIPKINESLKLLASQENEQKKEKEEFKPIALFRSFNLRMKVILLTIIWIANSIVYNTMAFNAPNLGNIFVAYIAQASVEAPACVFNLLLSNRIGRMPPLILSMILSSCFSFMCIPAYIGKWNEWFIIIFAALSKFGICISFNILYQATGELYPTSLRATGIGVNTVVSSLFTGAMPYIIETASTHKWLPMFILGIMTTIATVCACFLPETKDQPMPQTAFEAETMSKVGFESMKTHVKNVIKCNKMQKMNRR